MASQANEEGEREALPKAKEDGVNEAPPVLPDMFQGDFGDFLKLLKSPEDEIMHKHADFSAFLQVENLDGATGPQRVVTVSFCSGVDGKWNYQDTMTFKEFLAWKMKAWREAGFKMH
jgi:hypothetical protein